MWWADTDMQYECLYKLLQTHWALNLIISSKFLCIQSFVLPNCQKEDSGPSDVSLLYREFQDDDWGLSCISLVESTFWNIMNMIQLYRSRVMMRFLKRIYENMGTSTDSSNCNCFFEGPAAQSLCFTFWWQWPMKCLQAIGARLSLWFPEHPCSKRIRSHPGMTTLILGGCQQS